jgi:Flp pilus assembly protein TadG
MFGIPARRPVTVTNAGGDGFPHKSLCGQEVISNQPNSERGSITITTAIFMLLLLLMVGLCIDVSRIYMVRAELQNAADAAALTAARELNSSTAGIDDAVNRANEIVNTQGFGKAGVTIAKIEFAENLDGTYWQRGPDTTAHASTIRFVRVTTQSASISVLFAVNALGSSHSESRQAVAGMSVGLNTICNIFPIAVALTPANRNALSNGQQITFNYQDDISGSSAAVDDHKYAVIQVPCSACPGGHAATIQIAAGIPNICASLGQAETLDSSQSANKKNGRDAIADGANTRFDFYPNGGGGVDPGTYPPDTNVQEGLSSAQYLAKNPTTSPPRNPPGKDDRRILIMPIIDPLPASSSPTIQIQKFGAFLLRNRVAHATGCGKGGFCGADLELEYLGNNFVVGSGSYDPNNLGGSNLTIPVLYR